MKILTLNCATSLLMTLVATSTWFHMLKFHLMTTFAWPTQHTWSVLCTLIFHIVMMMIHGLFAIHPALTCFPVMFAFLMKWTVFEQLGLPALRLWRWCWTLVLMARFYHLNMPTLVCTMKVFTRTLHMLMPKVSQ